MRESKILAKLRSGKTALTFSVSCGVNTKAVEFAGRLGFDGVWIDMEHRNLTDADVETLILASRTADVDTVASEIDHARYAQCRAEHDRQAGLDEGLQKDQSQHRARTGAQLSARAAAASP